MDVEKEATMDQLYTDGACKGNPGRGGWAFLLGGPLLDFDDNTERTLSGGKAHTTNNRMALGAIIEGLVNPHGEEVEIVWIQPTYHLRTSNNRKLKHMDLIEVYRQLLAQVKQDLPT
jgi:hypothetical protein